MRTRTLLVALFLGACSTPAALPVPIAVVGDGEHGVLLAHEVLAHHDVGAVCGRATDLEQWQQLCRSFAKTLAKRAQHEPDFDDEQVVMVPLPPLAALTGIVVSSEEGVDVLTLDVALQDVPRTACLLRMSRRACQMAVILRDQQSGLESTVAVFSGL
tara:strand:- start:587 stop:1060 length:474 start_codon:yes stop_codon:yes gene_type:complete